MTELQPIETNRLLMRQWKASDFQPFASLNADPLVMEYFPNTLTVAESNALAEKIQTFLAEHGWGLWAIEEKSSQRFTGFVGLSIPTAELPCSPCVEIGWRLAQDFWGKGYATEAALASLVIAFEQLNLDEVVAFTSAINQKSRAVMERIHMVDTRQHFDHPNVAINSPLREHVLYKLSRENWNKEGYQC